MGAARSDKGRRVASADWEGTGAGSTGACRRTRLTSMSAPRGRVSRLEERLENPNQRRLTECKSKKRSRGRVLRTGGLEVDWSPRNSRVRSTRYLMLCTLEFGTCWCVAGVEPANKVRCKRAERRNGGRQGDE